MKNLFNSVKVTKPGRNWFDLSHNFTFTGNFGDLMPAMALEVVPGDNIRLSCEDLLRLQPLLAPVMGEMYITAHYWFISNRTLWPNWENYITATPVGGNLPVKPKLSIGTSTHTKLVDYMGVPPPINPLATIEINALCFAAYQCVYNEWYRSQDLSDPVAFQLVDGNNNANFAALTTLRKRTWKHDYYTAALPEPQKGPSVEIPVLQNFKDVPVRLAQDDYPNSSVANWDVAGTVPPDDDSITVLTTQPDYEAPTSDPLFAKTSDLNPSQPTTINELRTAFRLQEFAEKMARAGSRLVELILGHFGVRSSDQRLQRPEYITGMSTPVKISEVLNTTGTEDAPQGAMAGHGIAYQGGAYKKSYFCEEHGYIICMLSVMPKPTYMQNLPKHLVKVGDYTEYFWPTFANLGEQPILNKEIYSTHSDPEGVFGYIPRYAEYKYEPDRVATEMRDSLKFWTTAREFDTEPALNQDFVEMQQEEVNRIFAVPDTGFDKLIIMHRNNVMASRLMPKYGTPTF